MQTDRVLVPPPLLDEDSNLLQGREDLALKQLLSTLAVERFIEPILPWTPLLKERVSQGRDDIG